MAQHTSLHALQQQLCIETDAAVQQLAGPVGTATNVWGGTGLCVSFAETLRTSGTLQGKRVISLGSGLGVLELLCAAGGACALATDLPAVMPLLQSNINNNQALLDSIATAGGCRAAGLDWSAPLPPAVTHAGPFDLVLASDCVYWPSLFQPLINTLCALTDLAATPHAAAPHIFLAIESRQSAELQFFAGLDRAGFRWYRVEATAEGHGALARSSGQAVGLYWCQRAGSTSTLPRQPVQSSSEEEAVEACARTVWSYLHMNQPLKRSDLLLCLCSNDPRVAVHAATLWLQGWAPLLMFSGGVGKLTQGLYGGKSEAQYFADVALSMGVPPSSVLVEGESTNTGENIRFSAAVLRQHPAGLFRQSGTPSTPPVYVGPNRLLLVQKPYMERRSVATFEAQGLGLPTPAPPSSSSSAVSTAAPSTDWAATVQVGVTSPPMPWHEYPQPDRPGLDKRAVLEVMCGDLQRIALYPSQGFQTHQRVLPAVWSALQVLVQAGYTGHLLATRGSGRQQEGGEETFAGLEPGAPLPECVY